MVSSVDRIGCVWCPDWPVAVARRHTPELEGAPVAIVGRGERGRMVTAASPEARAEGVVVGQRRREAEASCPGLVVLDADDGADARLFETVVREVEQLVPRLVLERPGRLWFPTRGPSRYFGGDASLAARVRDVVSTAGVPDVRVGIADGELAAQLAARTTGDAGVRVVEPGESVEFLARWPVGVVAGRVEGGTELVSLLMRLGLRTLGAFAELPEAAVLGRFGRAGVHAHHLACGGQAHEAAPAAPPPQLAQVLELDPPAVRVDEAAFAAKALADRLLAQLAELGLCCTRVMVEAETEHGERLTRCWRHEGTLTPVTLMARVRWQLEAWLTAEPAPGAHADDIVTGGLALLRLVPEEVVPATGRQLGFWGGDPAAADRAARTLARVQGMLGHDAVVTAVPAGGRAPAERFQWVPWGEPREELDVSAPWPGRIPGPAPARVFAPALPAELVDGDGRLVTVSGRGEASAAPVVLRCAALPGGEGPITAWAGPWAHDLRWWDRRSRCAWWQVVVRGEADGARTEVACLVALTHGHATVEAIYD